MAWRDLTRPFCPCALTVLLRLVKSESHVKLVSGTTLKRTRPRARLCPLLRCSHTVGVASCMKPTSMQKCKSIGVAGICTWSWTSEGLISGLVHSHGPRCGRAAVLESKAHRGFADIRLEFAIVAALATCARTASTLPFGYVETTHPLFSLTVTISERPSVRLCV